MTLFRGGWTLPVCLVAACGTSDFKVPGESELRVRAQEGYCRAETDYGRDGTVDTVEHYYSDNDGRSLRWEVFEEGELQTVQTWELDFDGRILESVATRDGVEVFSMTFTYDSFGRELRYETHDGDRSLVRMVTAWNDAGQKTAATTTRGVETYSTTYAWDDGGRSLGNVSLRPDGSERSRVTITYDDDARTRTVVVDQPDGSSTASYVAVMHFDAHGNLVRDEISYPGEPSYDSVVEYAYDGDRVLTATTTDDFGGSQTEYVYCE